MIRLLTVIGARPQIIKAAAISRAVSNLFSDQIEERILHTGQHYDANMSQVFFDELGIPAPVYNLGIGSSSHGVQTARMIAGIEGVLTSERFDGIVLYGDTNSTLAGAVAASKIHVPIFHVESGLRSFNMTMPEEVNRIVCDHLSSVCFTPTQTGFDNLMKEGLMELPVKFKNGKGRLVVNSGDVMYDNSVYYSSFAEKRSDILARLGVSPNEYILTTIHRPNNTDYPPRLTSIVSTLLDITERDGITMVLPMHPRTRNILENNIDNVTYHRMKTSPLVRIIPPASFFDIIVLEKNARIVMTDSGGVQKESFFFERPCVILRPETEWVEILEHGAGIIADADPRRIMEAYSKLINTTPVFPLLFGNAHASELILETVCDYLNQ